MSIYPVLYTICHILCCRILVFTNHVRYHIPDTLCHILYDQIRVFGRLEEVVGDVSG